jgi:hypothetical protein
MTRTGGGASKDLGRRAFGTAGGWDASCGAPERLGEVVDLAGENLRKPAVPPSPRAWKPRAGSIHSFPVRTVVEEK